MHTFQPYPINMLEWNPMEKISKESFVVATELDGKPNAMTAGWGGVGVLWGKNVAFIFVRDSRYTKEILDETENFSCCFMDPTEKGVKNTLKYLGMVSGRDEDKMAGARLTMNHDMGIPFIDESQFVIVCKKLAAVPITPENILKDKLLDDWYKDGDYHTMYVGEIMDILAR
ncbi:MAG: flavin reductase [Bacteroidaceae bacterium]|nr:flavin reductase [Bacteroidaceae bacterium]